MISNFFKLKKSDFESEMTNFISHIIYLPRFCTSIYSKEELILFFHL